jgi:hypothetical protein
MWTKRNAYKTIVENPEGRTLGCRRHGWKDNIKVDLREVGWVVTYWIHLAQDRE